MAYIDKINKNGTVYDVQDSKAARSVDGDTSSHVEEADQIHTSSGVLQTEGFIYRTTAGDASISTGTAQLLVIKGKTIQTGHIDESLTSTASFEGYGIDRPQFVSQVGGNSDTYEFYMGDSWDWFLRREWGDEQVQLSDYGISIWTGDIYPGATLAVTYQAMVVGTLTTATPTSFVATGYNQYDATAGYAHVKGGNQYRIDGTYTSLGFTETVGGATTVVTVTNDKFTPESDGYIYVTGGSGDILIALVWSGVRDSDPFEAYETSTITIPTADAESAALPTASYGMPSVGDVADEINFAEKTYVKRIGQYAYSAQNLATVQAMGVDYWYDLTNIFYVLGTPVTYMLASSVSDNYTANDFGTEEFVGTTVPVEATLYYGNNLVDKLRNLLDIQSLGTGLSLNGSELSASVGSVVQTTGTSTTDVMSQKATSNMIYPEGEETNRRSIAIGGEATTTTSTSNSSNISIGYALTGTNSSDGGIAIGVRSSAGGRTEARSKAIAIGAGAQATGNYAIVLGAGSVSSSYYSVAIGSTVRNNNRGISFGSMVDNTGYYGIAIGAGGSTGGQVGNASARNTGRYGGIIGYNAKNSYEDSFAIGYESETSRADEISFGEGTAGDSAETTHYLAHIADPQYITDAANKRYVDTAVASAGATAFPTSTFETILEEA